MKRLYCFLFCICLISSFAVTGVTASTNTSGVFNYTLKNSEVEITGCTDKNISSVVIPDYIDEYPVTSIGDEAFSKLEELTSVVIGNNVKEIENNAFFGCSKLSSVTIPNGVETIWQGAFEHCDISNITLPESVNYIGNTAFCNTPMYDNPANWDNGLFYIGHCLVAVDKEKSGNCIIKDGIKVIGTAAFSLSNFKNVIIPKTVTRIEFDTFHGAKLESVTIPDGVTFIGYTAFYNCNNLKQVVIPNSVTYIDRSAFSYCENLESVTLSNKAVICDSAFYKCSSLTNVVIPEGVTSIKKEAFFNCEKLTNVTIPKSVTEIGELTFGFWYNENIQSVVEVPNFTISGYTDTAGHTYAKNYYFSFVSLDDKTQPITNPYDTNNDKKQTTDTNNSVQSTKLKKVTRVKVVSNKKKRIKVSWSKIKGAKKYVIKYSYRKNMKFAKKVSVKKNNVVIKNLKSGKKIYVRVQAIKGKLKSPWSAKKYKKIK